MSPETKKRLLATSEEGRKLASEGLDLLIAVRKQAALVDDADLTRVFGTFELSTLLFFETVTLLRDTAQAERPMDALLYSRLLLLTMYEGCTALCGALDHEFRAALARACAVPNNDDRVRRAHSALTKLRGRLQREWGDVRNGLSGHRDPNPEERLRLMNKAQPGDVVDMLLFFKEALVPLQEAEYEFQHALHQQLMSSVGQGTAGKPRTRGGRSSD